MDAYEEYLLNEFRPYTIQNNPFEVGSDRTKKVPQMDMSAQIQGELANKPAYDASGRRYGSTLSDDMFDIKNNRRGNPETSNHPWVGGYSDYLDMSEPIPEVQPAKTQTQELIQNYINAMTAGDIRDQGGRKKFIGEGDGKLYAYAPFGGLTDQYGMTDTDWAYEGDQFVDPDYEQYLVALDKYKLLKDRINVLQGKESEKGVGDSIYDDMKYIKSGGNTYHGDGAQSFNWDREYDKDPIFNYDEDSSYGFSVNPNRLSPKTAELIAKGTTQDRSEYQDYWGDYTGLNPIINDYRRMLGMTNHTPSGGAYMQGRY